MHLKVKGANTILLLTFIFQLLTEMNEGYLLHGSTERRARPSADPHTPHGGAFHLPIPTRTDAPELLDQGAGTLDDVRANLNEMYRLNQLLGGVSAITRYLFPRLLEINGRDESRPYSVLELGTGSGRLAAHIDAWARRNHAYACVIALDWAARNLTIAAENTAGHAVSLMQADALSLPFAPQSVDYVVSSLFMHHFTPDALITMLREAYQTARHGLIMSDLTRSYAALLSYRLMCALIVRHPLTKQDGMLSIRRAYTPDELRRLAHAAGIKHARVIRHIPNGMTLIAEKTHV